MDGSNKDISLSGTKVVDSAIQGIPVTQLSWDSEDVGYLITGVLEDNEGSLEGGKVVHQVASKEDTLLGQELEDDEKLLAQKGQILDISTEAKSSHPSHDVKPCEMFTLAQGNKIEYQNLEMMN
ncbi:hypothetical protein KY289_026721 [Solanum tuberosum]|nr:hypothetical protein KY289_026721 [Solanum tuberosum]